LIYLLICSISFVSFCLFCCYRFYHHRKKSYVLVREEVKKEHTHTHVTRVQFFEGGHTRFDMIIIIDPFFFLVCLYFKFRFFGLVLICCPTFLLFDRPRRRRLVFSSLEEEEKEEEKRNLSSLLLYSPVCVLPFSLYLLYSNCCMRKEVSLVSIAYRKKRVKCRAQESICCQKLFDLLSFLIKEKCPIPSFSFPIPILLVFVYSKNLMLLNSKRGRELAQ